jgi:cell division protein YceG involved in septum cleavage
MSFFFKFLASLDETGRMWFFIAISIFIGIFQMGQTQAKQVRFEVDPKYHTTGEFSFNAIMAAKQFFEALSDGNYLGFHHRVTEKAHMYQVETKKRKDGTKYEETFTSEELESFMKDHEPNIEGTIVSDPYFLLKGLQRSKVRKQYQL